MGAEMNPETSVIEARLQLPGLGQALGFLLKQCVLRGVVPGW